MKIIIIFIIVIYSNILYAATPRIVAHRGGKSVENNIDRFTKSIELGADIIEIDVQLDKNNKVVINHPKDSSIESEKNIILFSDILEKLSDIEIIIDFKSLPTKELVNAIIPIIDNNKAWNRLIFYSTNIEHIDYLIKLKPNANIFESRTKTRERLLKLRNEKLCCCYDNMSKYIGFELNREMIVEESFALGGDKNKINFKLWDENAVSCIKKAKGEEVRIFLFGIDNIEDYNMAKHLGVYGIFTDDILKLNFKNNE